MKPTNLLIIMSDEHTRSVTGCYGHKIVKTPNLDKLAAGGARYDSAYTTCPVCVPARASFATGKYVHQTEHWDNAIAFDGTIPSWHSLLRERGHHTASIGKLHFRSAEDDNGFSDEQIGMHIIDGKGDMMGWIRDDTMPKRGGSYKMAGMAGAGESVYTTYDREIAARAQVWLREEAQKHTDKPWVLFVSFVCPHFPLTAPPEMFYHYYDQDIPLPKLYEERHQKLHPYLEDYRSAFAYDEHFHSLDQVKVAQSGYLGLCTFLDFNIGNVLKALDDAGLADTTRVMYTSDHGDNNGARGLWGKSTLYEEASAVPLILSGPDIPKGAVVKTPVSFVDMYPFIIDCVGARDGDTVTSQHPGVSVTDYLDHEDEAKVAFSEYHGMGSKTAAFLVRKGKYKLAYYVAYEPQLFDLEADPEELNDLAADPAMKPVLDDLVAELNKIVDPAATDAHAKEQQQKLLAENGGAEAVIARGDLGFSMPPGVDPHFD